ncbi:hypothetical protein ACFT30_10450 [Microbacterium ureisolvens]|uniref:hypothetical protein n=1 Tax=Microbacterium ureisolvens TaxID=2781186 RepID=UPI00362E3A49
MSITEAFCADRLLNEVEAEIAPYRTASLSQIWDSAAVAAVSTWSNQRQRYQDWLKISDIDWSYIEALAIARNAIVHGLGKLTRQQLQKRQSNVSKLQSIGISVVDDKVQVGDNELSAIAGRCISHIEAVDEKVSLRTR